MAVSESFLMFVLEQLDGVRHVTHRRMFGGVGLYSGEHFFGILDNDRVYFKVDDRSVGDYIRAGMGSFRPHPTQPVTMTYGEVPVSVLEDRDELVVWARRAIDAAERSRSSKGSKSTTGSRGSKGPAGSRRRTKS
jgi:DNA transformation protein